ncbi:MAG TPA: polysaccharide deacetylase family protein [Candidatus Obscuribacterales bacterium]
MASFQQQVVENLALIFPHAIFYKPTPQQVVALTIDDVPIPGESYPCSTRWILDAIAEHNQSVSNPAENARATFFIIGSHLNRDWQLLTDIVAQGHELANHGFVDTWAALQAPGQFAAQFHQTHQLITEQVPTPLCWYRPGRAFYNPAMLSVVRQTAGYEPYLALASMLPLDTLSRTADPAFTVRYVAQHIFPGAILLLHGGSVARSKNTAATLRLLLPQLRSQGYRITTLSDLWRSSAPPLTR